MIDYYSPNLDLILIGCGFLGGYHLGAICLLKQIWPERYYERITGASCGGVLGGMVVSGVDLYAILDAAMDIIRQARRLFGEPFNFKSVNNLLAEKLQRLLPENGHKLCSSRFGLTLTNARTFDSILVSDFETRQDLFDAMIACCFIPAWSGSLTCPKYKDTPYLDGGFMNNKPTLEMGPEELESGRKTISLCPFPTLDDDMITPKMDDYWFELNKVGLRYKIHRDVFALGALALVPCKLSQYKTIFEQGFEGMKRYVLENDMIKCKKCFFAEHDIDQMQSMTKRYELPKLNHDRSKMSPMSGSFKKSCISCLKLKEKVDSFKPPEEFLKLMDD